MSFAHKITSYIAVAVEDFELTPLWNTYLHEDDLLLCILLVKFFTFHDVTTLIFYLDENLLFCSCLFTRLQEE